MVTVTDAELAHLKELEQKATPGPWEYDGVDILGTDGERHIVKIPEGLITIPSGDCKLWSGPLIAEAVTNAKFIAAAREAVPKLIAEVERLRDELRIKSMETETHVWRDGRFQRRAE